MDFKKFLIICILVFVTSSEAAFANILGTLGQMFDTSVSTVVDVVAKPFTQFVANTAEQITDLDAIQTAANSLLTIPQLLKGGNEGGLVEVVDTLNHLLDIPMSLVANGEQSLHTSAKGNNAHSTVNNQLSTISDVIDKTSALTNFLASVLAKTSAGGSSDLKDFPQIIEKLSTLANVLAVVFPDKNANQELTLSTVATSIPELMENLKKLTNFLTSVQTSSDGNANANDSTVKKAENVEVSEKR